MRSSAFLPLGLLAGALLSQYLGAAWAKTLFDALGPDGVTGLRVGLSAVLLGALFRPWRGVPARGDWGALLVYGAMLGGMNLCIYRAMALIPIGVAVAIEVTGPLAVALAGSRRARDLVRVALAGAGLLVLLPVTGVSGLDPLGVSYAFGAAFCWALYILAGKRVSGGAAGGVVFWGMLVASSFTVPLGLVAVPGGAWSAALLVAGLAVAVLSSVLPYVLEMLALRRVPAGVFGLIVSASPAVASVLGWLLLGEALSGAQGAAIACIVVASLGATWGADQTVSARDRSVS